MRSEVTLVLTDVSGLSLGTDHIKPQSWRIAKCSKHPLTSHHSTFVQGLRIHFHRYCGKTSRQWRVEHLKSAFKYKNLPVLLISLFVLCLCHTLRLFLFIRLATALHFPPPLSDAQEKWPHTSQNVTSLLSAGWCMRTKTAGAETADHTQIHSRLMDDTSTRSRIVSDGRFGRRWPAAAEITHLISEKTHLLKASFCSLDEKRWSVQSSFHHLQNLLLYKLRAID